MKLKAALEIISQELTKISGASPAFYIAMGFLLGHLSKEEKIEDLQDDEIQIEQL